jgi:uncharacterized protein YigA (DUF484 family)
MSQLTEKTLNNPITEEDIAHYLANTPDFFVRHSELLATVQLSSPHSHRAVSLQERQAEMLREKIKMLEGRMMEMIRHGNDNILLSDKVLRWARGLLLVPAPHALPALITQEIGAQFSVPQVGLRLWGLDAVHGQAAFTQGVSEDAKLFTASLKEPFCGLNTGFDATQWLENPEAASSLALIPLRSGDTSGTGAGEIFGMLVLASMDAQRFHSGMGTDFLSRIGEVASAALGRLR